MTLQIYDKMTVGQTVQQNTQAWDNQKEGLGPKTTETQTEFRLDHFRRRFSPKTLRSRTASFAQ